jgi:hydrogenase nickel incorporation protein HypA/HybF
MHEFAAAKDILHVLEQTLGAKREVKKVHLTLGPLSGIAAEALRFCFSELAKQEGLGSPELDIEEVASRVRCGACDTEYAVTDFADSCPACQSLKREILSGDEFTLDWAEVEDE